MYQVLAIPIISAFIGYITNVVAIKLLFWPRQPVNCYATGAVESDVSSLSRIGGLTDYNKYGTISNCHAEGNVTGAGYVYMGGLAGQSYSENTKGSGTSVVTILASITDSYATGNVVATSNPEDCPIGGLVGANSTTYTDSLQNVTYGIINCYATGSVSETGGEAYIGGLVGFFP
jgi:hypothetical protein